MMKQHKKDALRRSVGWRNYEAASHLLMSSRLPLIQPDRPMGTIRLPTPAPPGQTRQASKEGCQHLQTLGQEWVNNASLYIHIKRWSLLKTDLGFQGNPRTIHGGPRRDPNDMMGQTRASDGTGTQYPLGAGADPSAATRPTTATQTGKLKLVLKLLLDGASWLEWIGRQPDSNYQHLGNTNAYGPATVEMGGPESTTYPSHHREDAVGRMPERQLRAVQQTAYVHPYNTAQDPSSGPDLKQSQQAYENRSYKPSSGSDIYPPQNWERRLPTES